MTPKQKHDLLLYGGIGVGGVVIFFVVVPRLEQGKPTPSTSTPQKQTTNKADTRPQMMANPQQASVDEAFLQARTAALGMFDQTAASEASSQDQLIATNNETRAAQLIAFNQDATAYKTAGIMGPVEEAIANAQMNAEEVAARQQASAQVQVAQAQAAPYQEEAGAQQTSSWFSGITGLLGGLGSIFGF